MADEDPFLAKLRGGGAPAVAEADPFLAKLRAAPAQPVVEAAPAIRERVARGWERMRRPGNLIGPSTEPRSVTFREDAQGTSRADIAGAPPIQRALADPFTDEGVIGRFDAIQSEMAPAMADKVTKGLKQLTAPDFDANNALRGAGNVAVGGLGYLTSPVMSLAQAGVETLSGGEMVPTTQRPPEGAGIGEQALHATRQALAAPLTFPATATDATADATGMSKADAELLVMGGLMLTPGAKAGARLGARAGAAGARSLSRVPGRALDAATMRRVLVPEGGLPAVVEQGRPGVMPRPRDLPGPHVQLPVPPPRPTAQPTLGAIEPAPGAATFRPEGGTEVVSRPGRQIVKRYTGPDARTRAEADVATRGLPEATVSEGYGPGEAFVERPAQVEATVPRRAQLGFTKPPEPPPTRPEPYVGELAQPYGIREARAARASEPLPTRPQPTPPEPPPAPASAPPRSAEPVPPVETPPAPEAQPVPAPTLGAKPVRGGGKPVSRQPTPAPLETSEAPVVNAPPPAVTPEPAPTRAAPPKPVAPAAEAPRVPEPARDVAPEAGTPAPGVKPGEPALVTRMRAIADPEARAAEWRRSPDRDAADAWGRNNRPDVPQPERGRLQGRERIEQILKFDAEGGAPKPKKGATLGAKKRFRGGTGLSRGGPESGQIAIPGATLGARAAEGLKRKIDRLKTVSPELFHAVKDVVGKSRQRAQDAIRDVDIRYGQMTSQERKGLTPAFMHGRTDAGTPAQLAFRQWWWDQAEPRRQAFTKSGIRVMDEGGPREMRRIDKFFPQKPTADALKALRDPNSPESHRFYEAGVRQGAWGDVTEARKFLETYSEPSLKSYFAGIERPRKFMWPEEFLDPDVKGTIDSYLRRAHADAVEHEVFGYRDPATGRGINPDAGGSPQGRLGDILGRIPEFGDRKAAHDLAMDLLGRDAAQWSTEAKSGRALANTIGQVNALRLYGARLSTAIVQPTQNATTYALLGEAGMAKALQRATTNPREVYDLGIRSGAIHHRSEYAQVLGLTDGTSTPGNAASRALATAADKGMTLTSTTDLGSRMVAVAGAEPFAATMKRQLNGNSWQQRVARTHLESMDYTPAEIARFKEGNLNVEEMHTLRRRLVEITQGDLSNENRIALATRSTFGRVFMQGKGFSIEQARNHWRIAGRQLVHARNPVPAARLIAGTILVGYGIKEAKDLLTGPSSQRPDDTPGQLVGTTLREGGFGGAVGDMAHAAVRGKGDLNRTLDMLTDSQFERLLIDTGKLVFDLKDPPRKQIIGAPDRRKRRSEVFFEYLKRAAPTARDWERIGNRVFGGDSIVRNERRARIAGEQKKARLGASLIR